MYKDVLEKIQTDMLVIETADFPIWENTENGVFEYAGRAFFQEFEEKFKEINEQEHKDSTSLVLNGYRLPSKKVLCLFRVWKQKKEEAKQILAKLYENIFNQVDLLKAKRVSLPIIGHNYSDKKAGGTIIGGITIMYFKNKEVI